MTRVRKRSRSVVLRLPDQANREPAVRSVYTSERSPKQQAKRRAQAAPFRLRVLGQVHRRIRWTAQYTAVRRPPSPRSEGSVLLRVSLCGLDLQQHAFLRACSVWEAK